MKTTTLSIIAAAVIVIAACNSSKKSTTSSTTTATNSTASAPTPTTETKPKYMATNADKGIYDPGEKELMAIQAEYKDVTMEKLKEGHALYTTGACVNCHNAKGIYRHDEAEWKGIVDDMARKAKISDAQKDAVYMYVLSIKAMQPRGSR